MAEYIERDALPQKKERGFFGDDFNAGWNACLNTIKFIPAADVAPVRHGRWLESKYGVLQKCSICGATGWDEFNYCPNCGAKMDGGDTSERQTMAVQSQND